MSGNPVPKTVHSFNVPVASTEQNLGGLVLQTGRSLVSVDIKLLNSLSTCQGAIGRPFLSCMAAASASLPNETLSNVIRKMPPMKAHLGPSNVSRFQF